MELKFTRTTIVHDRDPQWRQPRRVELITGQRFTLANVGDRIPLHEHLHDHETIVQSGAVEVFDENGTIAMLKPGSPPMVFRAKQKHGCRAAAPATVVVNYAVVDCEPKAVPIESGAVIDFVLKVERRQLVTDSAA